MVSKQTYRDGIKRIDPYNLDEAFNLYFSQSDLPGYVVCIGTVGETDISSTFPEMTGYNTVEEYLKTKLLMEAHKEECEDSFLKEWARLMEN